MGSALYFSREIWLSPLEQRYVASCDGVSSYADYMETEKWKKRIVENSRKGDYIKINSEEIRNAFPTLAYLIASGDVSDERPLIDYFEGMDLNSHNKLLYKMAKTASSNKNIGHEKLSDILNHAKRCSVMVAKSDGSLVWSCDGIYGSELYDMFDVKPSSEYVIVHGEERKGKIIIREAEDDFIISELKKLPEIWKELKLNERV